MTNIIPAILEIFRRDSYRLLTILLFSISFVALISAYYAEYVIGLEPCPLCIYQRIPYMILMLFTATALGFKNLRQVKYHILVVAILLIEFVLAGYHSGVERGIFEPSNSCAPAISFDNMSTEEIKNMLYSRPVATCTMPALKILNLSMTEWNFILNVIMLGFVSTVLLMRNKNA